MIWILLINLIYLPAIWFGVIGDDSTALKLMPYPVKRTKFFNVLTHIVVAQYIYFAFNRIFPGYEQIFLIVAILFSIHPLTIQITMQFAGRHYGMSALAFLICLAFAPYAFPVYFLNIVSTTSVLFTPLLFIFTKYWILTFIFPLLFWHSFKRIWKANIEVKIKGDGLFISPLPQDFALHKWKWINFIIVIKTFGYYTLACLLPIKNGFYNSFLATLGSSKKSTDYWYSLNRHFWGGILAMIIMAVIWWFNKFNYIGMGIMLFVLSIGPFLNFITVQQFTAPRYAYLALIGFQVALVGLISRLDPLTQAGIFGALFLFYIDRTIRVMQHYKKDNITMIELDSQVFPDNPRLWYYRYEHMLHKNNPLMAWAEATYGLKYLPEDCQLWFGLACASFELGDMNAASKFLKNSEYFMMLTERKNMQELIIELRQRIKLKLEGKWKAPGINDPGRRFN